jgi:ATP-dependent helicase/nuclease subunit A
MLTPPQQQALHTSHHLGVIANAGSGKTLVLVERYLDIVCRGEAAVIDVVAITFTEKAAGELKRKIADGVGRRLLLQPADRAPLERVREQLSSALIHTIHGFCSRILREYPVEAGVDASFTIVDPIDQESLLQESFNEVYHAILREDAHPELKDPLLVLARKIGKRPLMHIVETLGRKHELARRLTEEGGLYARSDEDVLNHWSRELAARLERRMSDPALIATLQRIIGIARGKSAESVRAELDRLTRSADLTTRAQVLSSILSTVLTADGSIGKRFLGKGVEAPDPGPLADSARWLRPLIAALAPESAAAHAQLLRSSRILLAVYRLAMQQYQEKKSGTGQLDFDDLQLLTRELLKKEFVRNRLATRYKFIMVDEFQDTNRLQFEILLPLIREFRSGNLFIVGDPKQSIYGFRNADVEVFNRTCRDIREHAGPKSLIVLGESFRLLPDVAAFTNRVFTSVMGNSPTGNAEYDVAYDELIVARNTAADGRVELMLLSGEPAAMTEGEAVARRIRQLHGQQFQVLDREEHPHDLRFKDIAILLRSRKSLGEFEKSLVQYGIPYAVTGGTGYFQTQTIFDFYNYFRFVLNRHDDVALAGILRSPFFSVSDAELFQAAGEYRSGSLWDYMNDATHPRQAPALGRAVRMLNEDLTAGPRMTVPELIDRIVDRTGIEAVSDTIPRGDQGLANIRKLADLARSYDGRGFTTLYDFTARLKRLVEEEEKEGQAVIDVQRDAVRILTVHAAKGLEFPVVIVSSLERTFLAERQPFLDETFGVGFDHSPRDDEAGPTPLTAFLGLEARARSMAEEKRIFYVACTRARDCLILSGRRTGSMSASWLRWLEAALQLPSAEDQPLLEIPVSLTRLVTRDTLQRREERTHTLRIHRVGENDLAVIPDVTVPERVVAEPARIAIGPVIRPARGEMFSASKIRAYMECPAKYYLRYVLGMPEMDSGAGQGSAHDDDRDDPMEPGRRGTIIHRVLQQLDGKSAEDLPVLVRRLVAAEGGVGEKQIAEIIATAAAVLGSEFWKVIVGGTQAQIEMTLTGTLGEDYVTGTIDRLFLHRDGVWHVVDYKTDKVDADRIVAKGAGYLPQLKLYAFLVNRVHPGRSVRCSLLFTDHVQSPLTFTFSHEDLVTFGIQLRITVDRINSLDFMPLQSPCAHCPFTPHGCHSLIPPPISQSPKG